jgi:hypothetical protein
MEVCGKEIKINRGLVRTARLAAEGYQFLELDPQRVVQALREANLGVDLFTFTQRVPDISPRFSYPMEWDNCAALEVTSFDHWWTKQIRAESRNRARQAEKKGVIVREVPFDESLVKGIWQIYNECPIRAGRRFPHYGKTFRTVFAEAATFLDSSFYIGAFLNNQLIGFVKLTMDETRTQANLMNILSMIAHRDKAPTNALIASSIRACAERRIPYLVYQRYSYGKKSTDGVMKFKEVNGFTQYDLPRYYVPLTRWGRLAFKLELHHRWTDRLPASLSNSLRAYRTAWYEYAVSPAKKAIF